MDGTAVDAASGAAGIIAPAAACTIMVAAPAVPSAMLDARRRRGRFGNGLACVTESAAAAMLPGADEFMAAFSAFCASSSVHCGQVWAMGKPRVQSSRAESKPVVRPASH